MSKSSNTVNDPSYQQWLEGQSQKRISNSALTLIESELRKKVLEELSNFKSMDATEYTLWHKFQEIQEWLPNQDKSHIDWVKRNIWKPKGRSDFRRIEPELIFVKEDHHLKSKNIWGEDVSITVQNKEPHGKHWEIMRTLISSGRNDGTIGRAIRFIVRDKNTKMYLGVICLSSSMAMLKPRNDVIGWKKSEEFFYRGGPLVHIANGQSIVPTQPFGSAYLGGKLLSLLCLSDVVADKWKEQYGQKLVEVDTTSLWGEMKGGQSQYDNLNPYWDSKLGDTQGQTPLKPSDSVYHQLKDWMRVAYPEDFYRHYVEMGPTGKLRMRENKSRAILFCFQKLGIKKEDFLSDHKRGVYRSRLYTNTDAFLRGEITEAQLIPAFDNSVQALTEFWKFGSMGDTKVLDTDSKSKLKNDPKKISNKVRMKGMVKGQVDARDPTRQIPLQGNQVDWYQDLGTMSWQQAKEKYGLEVGR
jgi:Domain of unknown function (DUF4338)